MIDTLLLSTTIAMVVITIDIWLDRKFPCKCGRTRTWYFDVMHERAGLMLGRAIWCTVFAVLFLVTVQWVLAPVMALFACWHWRRWYFHEKDKLKKRAAKLAGVVGFNRHGKLVVKTAES